MLRRPDSEAALEFSAERLTHRTFVLGEPFSLTPGAENGRSSVTALRVAQEWVRRTSSSVVAVRSRFSFGVDAMGATIHGDGTPDGRFFAWLGQFQAVRRTGVLDSQLIFRSDLQLSNDPLLPLEQIALGGRYSVRGYRETTLLRDRALLASVELRVPLIRNTAWADYLEVAPFLDFARGWNRELPTPEPRDLSSIGVGLRWAVTVPGEIPIRPQLEIYWGHRLRKVEKPGENLQDKGIHMQFIVGTSF